MESQQQKILHTSRYELHAQIHGVLSHAAEQMKRFGGMGDLLQQAESHSKMEAKLHNKKIKAVTNKVKWESKREFKKRIQKEKGGWHCKGASRKSGTGSKSAQNSLCSGGETICKNNKLL
jgi:hypothetical protein